MAEYTIVRWSPEGMTSGRMLTWSRVTWDGCGSLLTPSRGRGADTSLIVYYI